MGHYKWPCATGDASMRFSTWMSCPNDIHPALTPGRGLVLLSVPKASRPLKLYQLWLFIAGLDHVAAEGALPVFICRWGSPSSPPTWGQMGVVEMAARGRHQHDTSTGRHLHGFSSNKLRRDHHSKRLKILHRNGQFQRSLCIRWFNGNLNGYGKSRNRNRNW